MPLTPTDLDAVCDLVQELCGISLDESKGYLIESRLGRLKSSLACPTWRHLVEKVRTSNDPQLELQVVDAITINETLFFRDHSTFEALRHKALPELIDSKQNTPFPRRMRIWSAACSTGQEPYSLAMTLAELIPDVHRWDVQIVATDISDAAIARASRGWYAQHEIDRGMTPERLARHFRPEGEGWRVRDELRSLIVFRRQNLLEPLVMGCRFDIIFCRNVAIYFTPQVRRDLFTRLTGCLSPGGYLFVGGQESLSDLGPNFAPQHHCRGTFYRPNLRQMPVYV